MSITTALSTARKGTVFLSIVCFAISYIALADLAHIAGLGPEAADVHRAHQRIAGGASRRGPPA